MSYQWSYLVCDTGEQGEEAYVGCPSACCTVLARACASDGDAVGTQGGTLGIALGKMPSASASEVSSAGIPGGTRESSVAGSAASLGGVVST